MQDKQSRDETFEHVETQIQGGMAGSDQPQLPEPPRITDVTLIDKTLKIINSKQQVECNSLTITSPGLFR